MKNIADINFGFNSGRKLALAAVLGLSASTALFSNAAYAWNSSPTNVSMTNQEGLVVPGKLFKPAGNGPFPAVVMLHGCSGIYSNSDPSKSVANTFRDWGDRLVGQGYVALLVDSFTPRGTQNQCGNGAAGVSEVNDRPLDAYAAYNFLSAVSYVDAQRIGLLGWSHGASSALVSMERTAVSGQPFKAAVAFYPGCGLYNAFGGVSESTWAPYAPVKILHGSDDALYQDGRCATRVSRATAQGASVDLTVYTGAKHSFDMAGISSGTYNAGDYIAKSSGDSIAMSLFNSQLR